jgi:hypothetical protein
MERQMDFAAAGSGFFHPFARSIAPPRPAASPQPVAKAESARPQVVRSESPSPPSIPTSGGFVNPQARPARQ